MKVVAQSVVDRCYGLQPSPDYLARFQNDAEADNASRKYTKRRIKYLIGDKKSRYLSVPVNSDVCLPFSIFVSQLIVSLQEHLRPYTHIGIKIVILEVLFNPKSRPKPLALVNLEALDPIPVECIAFAATAVS